MSLEKNWDSKLDFYFWILPTRGAFGIVQMVVDKETLETYACKQVKKMAGSTSAYEQVMKEIELMKKISHKHILQLKEVLETPKKVYMVLEW